MGYRTVDWATIAGVVISFLVVLTVSFGVYHGVKSRLEAAHEFVIVHKFQCYVGIQVVMAIEQLESLEMRDGPVFLMNKDGVSAVYKLANGEICYWQSSPQRR